MHTADSSVVLFGKQTKYNSEDFLTLNTLGLPFKCLNAFVVNRQTVVEKVRCNSACWNLRFQGMQESQAVATRTIFSDI